MRATKPMLLLLAWVVLDLGCPFLGGGFVFDAEDSVEAVRSAATRDIATPGATSPRSDLESRPECPKPARLARRWPPCTAHRAEPGRAHVLAAHPSSSAAEDH